MRHRRLQEVHRGLFLLVGQHLCEAHPRVVVDGDVGELPAGAVHRVTAVAGDPMARSHDAPQFLGVHVQQFARCLTLVAHRGRHWVEGLQAGQPQAGQETADGGDAAPHLGGDPAHRHAPTAQPLDAFSQFGVNGVAGSIRTRAAVAQSLLAAVLEAQQPLACRLPADSGGLGRRNQPHDSNALDQQLTPFKGQSGILVTVHLVGFLWDFWSLVTPVSQTLRVNNLLKHHS